MNARDELAELVRVVCTGPLFSMTTKEAEDIAAAILSAGYRKPRTITTREEVYALREGSVVVDSAGDVSQLRGGFWCSYEATEMTPQRLAKYIPATVLHEGEAA